jgi:hypothetical protein
MKRSQILPVVIAAIALFSGCDDNDAPTVALSGDYLPINSTSRRFLREQFSQPDLADRHHTDTIRIAAAADVVLEGRQYHMLEYYSTWDSGNGIVESHDVYKYFRKEGSRYLSPSFNEEDHIFLDTELPVGSSWSYTSPSREFRETYTIKAVNATRTFNGVTYTNVIEVESKLLVRDDKGHFDRVNVTTRYFAKDIGEVYSLSSFYFYTMALRVSALE